MPIDRRGDRDFGHPPFFLEILDTRLDSGYHIRLALDFSRSII